MQPFCSGTYGQLSLAAERHPLVAQHAFLLQMLKNGGGALAAAHFDAFRRFAVALVRRTHRAPEEPAGAEADEDGEDADGGERLQDFAAAAGRRLASYDVLRCCS